MANNSKSTVSLARACRSSFLTAVTFRNNRWKLHQLHGLHQLLLDAGQELISALAEEFSLPVASYEREYTLVLQDVASHYLSAVEASTSPQRTTGGTPSLRSLPVGVSLIITNSTNPFRFALAPLASSIAACNTVILATESKTSKFFTLLIEKAELYLDCQSIHIVQGLDLQDSIVNEVDHICILDKHPRRYSTMLASQIATFCSTESGPNIAVIDNGSKLTSELTKKIYRGYMLPHSLAPERLTAVFIHHREFQAFAKSFSMAFGKHSSGLKFGTKRLTTLGFIPFVGDTYQAELSCLVQSSTRSKSALSEAIKVADEAGVLLVLLYTSLEQVMDGISTIKIPPLQIALLAPASESHVNYFERWTRSKVLSIGSIRSVIPPVIQPCSSPSTQASQPLFPPVIFGQLRLKASGEQQETPSITSAKKQTETIVKPPAPEPNQTMDFFGYMKRVFIVVGLSLGGVVAAGLWVAYKRIANSHS